jgi:hypothetical protein
MCGNIQGGSSGLSAAQKLRAAQAFMVTRTGLALSIQQPWAWLIVNGYKPVENRDWSTRVRGWIGIHAGKKFDREGYDWARATFPDIPLPALKTDYPMGGIVGRARLIDCVRHMDSPWFFGKYGFVMTEAEPLSLLPCRGKLGFFRPDTVPTQEEQP